MKKLPVVVTSLQCLLSNEEQSSVGSIMFSDMHSRIVGVGFSDRFIVPSFQGECEWSRHRKQGVYFFRSPWESSGDGRAAVSYSLTFEPSLGDIKMDFSIESQWCGAITDSLMLLTSLSLFMSYLTFVVQPVWFYCSDWSFHNSISDCYVTFVVLATDQNSVF